MESKYTVLISTRAQKGIRKLKELYQDEMLQALRELREDPFIGKPLTEELSGRYTYKIDVYRIVYIIREKDKIVLVVAAGHRSIVY